MPVTTRNITCLIRNPNLNFYLLLLLGGGSIPIIVLLGWGGEIQNIRMSQWAPFYHPTHETRAFKKCMLLVNYQEAGQIIIFHLDFPWNKRFPLQNHHGGLVVWGRYNLGQADKDVTSLGQLWVAEKKTTTHDCKTTLGKVEAVNMRWLSKTHMADIMGIEGTRAAPNPTKENMTLFTDSWVGLWWLIFTLKNGASWRGACTRGSLRFQWWLQVSLDQCSGFNQTTARLI